MRVFSLPNQSYRWLVAELVVVVLGILIAFQVDEWRVERSSRIEEKVILVGLREEFLVNIETLTQITSRLVRQQNYIKEFLYKTPEEAAMDNSTQSIDDLFISMHRTMTNRGITHGFLNTSINSGKFAVISSQPLQAKLLEVEDFEREMDLLAEDIRELTDKIIMEMGKYSDTAIPFWDETTTWDTVTPDTISLISSGIRKDESLIPSLAAKAQRIGPYIGIQNRLATHLQEIVEIIDVELN